MEVIDWSKLRTKDGKQDNSFELFCYCIAQKKFGHLGKFTSIDGSGGDGGIEFYLELEDGNIWGWQAKYFPDTARLNHGSRKDQIKDSLKSACKNHGEKLKKWFICTNSDFTPKENKWFQDILKKEVPAHLPTKVIHWGKDKFNTWLITESKPSGLLYYFFGELELTTGWFKDQYQVQFASVKDKFIKELHTENSTIYKRHIQPLLFEKETSIQIQEMIEDADKRFSDYKFSREKLVGFVEEEELTKEKFEIIFTDLETFEGQYEECLKEVRKLVELTTPNRILLLKEYLQLIDSLIDEMEIFQKEEIFTKLEAIPDEYLETNKGKKHYGKEDGRAIRSRIKQRADYVLHWTRKIVDFLKARIEANDWHFFGDKGIGKTHLCCSIVSNLIEKNQPAIFITAAKFTSTVPLLTQLKQILHIPESYSVEHFFDALDMAGFSKNVRCPIVIDGINESTTDSGKLNPIWSNYLPSLVEMISQRKSLVLITTCRPSYEKTIWQTERRFPLSNRVNLDPFDSEDTEILVRRYFKYYRINADLTYQSFNSFDKPLHLKIFCEAKNAERINDVEVELGDELIYDSFSDFIEVCNRHIYQLRKQKFGLPPSQKNRKIATDSLVIIGKYLWENHTRYINVDEFYQLMDNGSGDYTSSKTNALVSEGLLFCRDIYDGKEVIGITYDMLSGYAIANYLFQKYKDDFPKFIKSKEALEKLFADNYDYSKCHPQFEDIRECITALLPQKTGKHYYEVLSKGKAYESAFDLAYEMIFKVSSKFITQKETDFITASLEIPENRSYTFRFAKHLFCSTKNPFNIKYWSTYLKKLSLVDRDLSWSEFLRENNHELLTILNDFEEVVRSSNISKLKEDRTHLMAEYALWSMTTVNISTRDKASKGLYYYGRKYPYHFFELLKLSFEINDPVIRERMILIAYGITLARRYDFSDDSFVEINLPLFAKIIFEFLFKPKSKYATTHILIRETGKCIIELAQKHHPKLFSTAQMEHIYPPYKNREVISWKELEDQNEKNYREGNAPIDYYFEKYKLPLIAPGDIYKPNKEMQKAIARLFGRITDLGYEYELFKNIDIRLARRRDYGRDDSEKITKYGEKYATVALFELAGFMYDRNELEIRDDLNHQRFALMVVDPTFPESKDERDFFTDDLLDREKTDLKKWIFQEKIPDLRKLLKLKDLNSEGRDWVLINASIIQTDEELQKQISLFPMSIFVKTKDSKKIKKIIAQQKNNISFLGNYDSEANIYQGEIPHSNLVQRNGIFEFSYEVGTEVRTREVNEVSLYQNGIELNEEEVEKIFFKIKNDYGLNILSTSFTSGLPIVAFTAEKNSKSLEEVFQELNLSEKIEVVNKDYTATIEDSFHYEFPLCKEHSSFLSKELYEYLKLVNQPQSYNLYERNGQPASILFKYGEGFTNTQSFLYLRKDLLNKYLNDHNLSMLHIVKGERMQYAPLNASAIKLRPHYKVFNRIYDYNSKP